jgi:hypothetical protein
MTLKAKEETHEVIMAGRAGQIVQQAIYSVETHVNREELQVLYWFVMGLVVAAFETSYRDTPFSLWDKFGDFTQALASSIYPDYEKRFGPWDEEEAGDNFTGFLEGQWGDAEEVWVGFIENARQGLGHLALSKAIKDAEIFKEPELRTIATMAGFVVAEGVLTSAPRED